jgi:hypothetical protein
MPYIPLSARRSMFEERSPELEVLLVTITHVDLDEPVRLSSDPTERLSTDPLIYGTTSNGNEFLFVLMGAILPDDRKGSPPRTSLTFDNIDSRYVELARSFTSPAYVDLKVVFASAPNLVTQHYTGLRMTRVSYDESSMTFDISRELFLSEPFGARQTKNFFPGLHGLPNA